MYRVYAVSVSHTAPKLLRAVDQVRADRLLLEPWQANEFIEYPEALSAHYKAFTQVGLSPRRLM